MTTTDLKNAAAEIEAKFFELGGKKEFFSEFLLTLGQSVEFGLNAEWVTTPLDLVSQWFNGRYAGEKQKTKLADVVSAIHEREGNGDKTYSILDKKFI
jgi:hypothetical protein